MSDDFHYELTAEDIESYEAAMEANAKYEEELLNDPDYQAHIKEIYDDYDRSHQARYSAPFVFFLNEIYNSKLLIAFLHHHTSLLMRELNDRENDISNAVDSSSDKGKPFLDHQFYLLQERQRQLEYSSEGMKKSQYKMIYSNAINTLENYMLEMGKLLVQAEPKKFKTKMVSEFELSDLTRFIDNKEEMWDYIFRTFLKYDNKESSLNTMLRLTKSAKIIQPHEALLMALKRAQAVRHKLTHRHGIVDESFLQERKTLQAPSESDDTNSFDKFKTVGNSSILADRRYNVTLLETSIVLDLVEEVAGHFESQIKDLFPSIPKFNILDLEHEFDHADAMLREWKDRGDQEITPSAPDTPSN